VVVVKNYQGPRLDSSSSVPLPPIKSGTPGLPEEVEAAEVDEKDRAVDEAIKAVVAEWQQKENDINCNGSNINSNPVGSIESEDKTAARDQDVEEDDVNSITSGPDKTEEIKVPVEGKDNEEKSKSSGPDITDEKEEQKEEEKEVNSNTAEGDPKKAIVEEEEDEDEVDDAVAVQGEEET